MGKGGQKGAETEPVRAGGREKKKKKLRKKYPTSKEALLKRIR